MVEQTLQSLAADQQSTSLEPSPALIASLIGPAEHHDGPPAARSRRASPVSQLTKMRARRLLRVSTMSPPLEVPSRKKRMAPAARPRRSGAAKIISTEISWSSAILRPVEDAKILRSAWTVTT